MNKQGISGRRPITYFHLSFFPASHTYDMVIERRGKKMKSYDVSGESAAIYALENWMNSHREEIDIDITPYPSFFWFVPR